MKRLKNHSAIVVSILLLTCNMAVSQERIEGLFYLDHTPISVEFIEGKISKVTRLDELSSADNKAYIGPGFIDNQVNGFAGITFALGSGDLTLEGVKKATRELWKYGVTTYLPTLTTNDSKLFLRNLSILQEAKEDGDLYGSIAGFHLEGPYISPDDGFRGAHPSEHVRLPDWEEFMEFYKASGSNIIQITLAPELEGALEFISKCRENDIAVALGHHNAPAETVIKAIDLGAQVATHLGNGAAIKLHRHNNPFWSQLTDDRLMISIICDGFHLPPEVINTFYKVKGTDRTIITSDVTSYGGLPTGLYQTEEGDPIEITPEGKLMNLAQNGLYGSASPITKGVGHVIEVTGCSLSDAVKMASTNPAILYGLNDRGEIKPGMRADIVVFTIDEFKIEILKTIVDGHVVYSSP